MCMFVQCKCVDPKNLGEPPVSCGLLEYKGDGNCDDENNNKGCAYDGGDCCYKSVKGGKVKKDYCKEVGGEGMGWRVSLGDVILCFVALQSHNTPITNGIAVCMRLHNY